MDINELKGKRVRLILNAIAHNGSADVRWPGISSFGVGGFRNQTLYNNARDIYREDGEPKKPLANGRGNGNDVQPPSKGPVDSLLRVHAEIT